MYKNSSKQVKIFWKVVPIWCIENANINIYWRFDGGIPIYLFKTIKNFFSFDLSKVPTRFTFPLENILKLINLIQYSPYISPHILTKNKAYWKVN